MKITYIFIFGLFLFSCAHDPLLPFNGQREISAEAPLHLMVTNAGRSAFAENIFTQFLVDDTRIQWIPITSGTQASHYIIYPEELDKKIKKAIRSANGMVTILETLILPSDLKELESGNYSLKILEYIPESQDFGTTALDESVNFKAIAKSLGMPPEVKIINADNNRAISLLVPLDQLDQFKKRIEKQLPIRVSYQSNPIEKKLFLRVTNVGQKAFAEDALTEHLANDPRIQWFSITSGSRASH
ncbi:MAG: hypothetical protein K2Q18_07945, partial [Bdellovibrionales bacterium]|nr:hypothetical protein [Bdellovibrionales bacterium]